MEALKQSTLDFSKGQVRISSRSPSLDARPSPEIPSTTKHTKRKPVTQAFDHGKHRQQDGYVSDGQEVSESEEEAKLETTSRGRKQVKVSSDEDQSQSGTEDEESEEMDSEEMMDLEASDDEDYQSGDSLDEDEGGNRRRKKKDKGKGKRKRRESTDESVEVIEPKRKVDKGKRRKIVESDEDDVEIVEQPVASTSRATASQTPLSPSRPISQRTRPPSSFLGVVIPPRSHSKSPSATPVPRSPVKPNNKSSKSKLAPTNDSEESDSPPPRLPSSSTRKSKGKKRAVVASSSSSASDSSPFEEPESLRKDRKKRQKRSRADSSTPKKKKRSKKKKLGKLSQGVRDRRSADESSEPEGESESNFFVVDDDVEESSEWSESERERLLGVNQARKKRKELEEIRERDKEEVRRIRLAAKEKGKGKEKAVESDVEDDDEDEPVRSGRRIPDKAKGKAKEKKSKSGSKKGKTKKVVDELEESEEDEEDLGIDGEETVVDQRLRTTKSSTANKFEQLRAARQSKLGSSSQAPIVIDSSNEGSASPAPVRRKGPRYAGGSESDEGESEGDSATSGQRDQSQHDDDSDDFIASDGEIEDDEEAQREMDKIRSRAQGFNYYLKNYLLYLVHLIVVPEADWLAADPEFRDAQQKVEGRLQGIISSGISSGGWKPDFKAVVDARPNFDYQDLTGLPPCDACSAGEHRRAVFVGTFSGARYNRKTLKPLETSDEESSSSSSSSDDDESEDQDEAHPLSMTQKTSTRKNKKKNRRRKDRDQEFTFNLGRFCAGRCITYHQLQHWPFQTRQKVARKVLPLLDTSVKAAKRKKGMTPDEWLKAQQKVRRLKEKDASRIGGVLDRKGVIKDLADTIEAQLDRAIKDFSSG